MISVRGGTARSLAGLRATCAGEDSQTRRLRREDDAGRRCRPMAEDVPGLNESARCGHDEVLLADKEVFYHSQIHRIGRRRDAGGVSQCRRENFGRV